MFGFLENDYTKFWSDLFFVNNTESLLETLQQNVEATNRASKLVLEGVQATSQRQSDIAKRSVGDIADATLALSNAQMGRDKVIAGTDVAQKTIEKSLNDARELNEMLLRSQRDALKTMSDTVLGNFEMFKKNMSA